MMRRALGAALHRLGVIARLRAAWRQDLEDVEARAAGRIRKAAADTRALHDRLQTLEERQRTHWDRLKEAHAATEQLVAEVARLADACKALDRRARGLEQVIVRNRREAARLQAFRQEVERGAVAAHVASALASAPLIEDPAPMLVIERLFPDAVYDTIVEALPPVDAFAPTDRTKANYRVRRPEVAVSDLTEYVWSYVNDDLIPRTMVPAIGRRFAPFVDAYYRELFGGEVGARVADLPLAATDARLMLRRPGYHLDPHLDPKRVLLTTLLYFARPGESEAYGTTFYRVDGRVVRDHATTYYPQRYGHRCEPVRVVPFRPNTAVVFLNSAAHGADIPASAPCAVERHALQFYVGPPLDALRSLVGALPSAERGAWAELLE